MSTDAKTILGEIFGQNSRLLTDAKFTYLQDFKNSGFNSFEDWAYDTIAKNGDRDGEAWNYNAPLKIALIQLHGVDPVFDKIYASIN